MQIPNPKLISYVNANTGLDDVKYLPQNVKKNSRPAKLVNKYGNGDPNQIIWLYHPEQRYVGVMVRNAFKDSNPEVTKWVNQRISTAKKFETGVEYTIIFF